MGITGRSTGYRITASQRIKLGVRLRELLEKEPDLTIAQLVKRTGSPYDMANFIRKRFKEEQAAKEAEHEPDLGGELCHGMGQS